MTGTQKSISTATMPQKIIVLDPGHGSTIGALGYDPGVPDTVNHRNEAELNYDMALTLKSLLVARGFKVVLTRDLHDGGKVDLNWRLAMAQKIGAVAFIAIHYNSVGTYPVIYFAPGIPSLNLARMVAKSGALSDNRIWPSSSSRFHGLYIDAFPRSEPSILWEVAAVDKAPVTGPEGSAARLKLAIPTADAIAAYFKGK